MTPIGTKSFDDPAFLNGREKYAVLSTPGVASAEDLVVGFANWRKPERRRDAVVWWSAPTGTDGAPSSPGTSCKGSLR